MVATAKSVASLYRDPSLQSATPMQCLVSQSAACLESGSLVLRHAHLLSVEKHSLVEANDANLVKYYFLSLHCKKNDEKVMN